LDLGLVGGPVALQVDGVDDADGPVGHEIGAAVFRREGVVVVELQADGRAAAGLVQGRQAVDVVVGRVGRAGAPDEIGAGRAVGGADGPVPRQALVPLHVAVKSKQLSIGAEGDVEVVAEAGGDEADVPAVEVHAPDGAPGGEDVGGVAVGV